MAGTALLCEDVLQAADSSNASGFLGLSTQLGSPLPRTAG